jgi:hypothetical protein
MPKCTWNGAIDRAAEKTRQNDTRKQLIPQSPRSTGKRYSGKALARRMRFVREYLRSGSTQQAYAAAYAKEKSPNSNTPTIKPSSLQVCASRIFHELNVKDNLSYWLSESGLSLVQLNNKLTSLLDCTTTNRQGKEVQDNTNQRQSLELAYKLHGVLDGKTDKGALNNTTTVNISITGHEQQLSDAVSKLCKLSSMMSERPNEGEIIDVDSSSSSSEK